MYYQQNRKRAQIKNCSPTLTDQSQANDADINIIVGKMLKTGITTGAQGQPIYQDWTTLPTDLRTMIETSRDITRQRAQLPQPLREMPIEQLLQLTPDELTNILTPPAPPPAPTGDKQT